MNLLQVIPAGWLRWSGLVDQGLPQGVVAFDVKLIPGVQPLEKASGRNPGELAACSAIATPARQYQIPDAVEVQPHELGELSEGDWEEMIHVHVGAYSLIDQYLTEAVEAPTLLVTVQGITATRHVDPCAGDVDEQGFKLGIVLEGEQLWRKSERPCGLYQPPPGFDLDGEVRRLIGCRQGQEGVRERDPIAGFAVIHEEPLRNLALVHDVKRVDDVVEAEADGGVHQSGLVQLALIELTAGVEELAALGGDLLLRLPEVFRQVAGVGDR